MVEPGFVVAACDHGCLPAFDRASRTGLWPAEGQREPGADAAFVSLRELFEASDIVSLHLPFTVATEHLVDAATLGLMKPGSILVNTAHAGPVDEAALADALASGHLGAAGLDIWPTPPLPPDHTPARPRQRGAEPGRGGRTPEALRRALAVAAETARRLRDGRPLLHRIA